MSCTELRPAGARTRVAAREPLRALRRSFSQSPLSSAAKLVSMSLKQVKSTKLTFTQSSTSRAVVALRSTSPSPPLPCSPPLRKETHYFAHQRLYSKLPDPLRPPSLIRHRLGDQLLLLRLAVLLVQLDPLGLLLGIRETPLRLLECALAGLEGVEELVRRLNDGRPLLA